MMKKQIREVQRMEFSDKRGQSMNNYKKKVQFSLKQNRFTIFESSEGFESLFSFCRATEQMQGDVVRRERYLKFEYAITNLSLHGYYVILSMSLCIFTTNLPFSGSLIYTINELYLSFITNKK